MDPSDTYAKTVPHLGFAVFQMMFAIITPALITGAFAERIKFSAFCLFTALWSIFVYSPAAHWVWGAGGWLGALGCLDFAGGTCIHILSGVSGLTACIYIGIRKGYGKEAMQEGWHYDLESAEAPLTYRGVVYNEMKGAFSSPDALMERRVMRMQPLLGSAWTQS